MAKEHTMDISVKFEFQELKNAVEQTKKESANRYDLKDADVDIDLSETEIKVTTGTEMQIESVFGILVQKMIARGVSPKILDRQKIQEIGGMRTRQEMKLIKALDQETSKKLTNIIREQFPKAKPNIHGETIRISSPSIDILQQIISHLNKDETIKVPLEFGNYR